MNLYSFLFAVNIIAGIFNLLLIPNLLNIVISSFNFFTAGLMFGCAVDKWFKGRFGEINDSI